MAAGLHNAHVLLEVIPNDLMFCINYTCFFVHWFLYTFFFSFQSYNERYVGWKIQVVDQIPTQGSSSIITHSTMLIVLSLIICSMFTRLIR